MRRSLSIALLVVASIVAVNLLTAPAAQAAVSTARPIAGTPAGDDKPDGKADDTGGVIVTPQGASCFLGCSETANQSAYSVYTARNWCVGASPWAGNTMPSCSDGNVAQQFLWIAPYTGRTPDGQDWDGFRVDAGWCYHVVLFSWPGPWRSDFQYDRRGMSTGLWVHVHNNELAYVTSQGTTHC